MENGGVTRIRVRLGWYSESSILDLDFFVVFFFGSVVFLFCI